MSTALDAELDEEVFDERENFVEEEEGDLDAFFGDEADADPCGRAQFQMNMMMPGAVEGLEDEPPIDLFVKGSAEAITA